MKKPFKDQLGDFLAGKGFYLVLLLCVAAIGVSGYYLYDSIGQANTTVAVPTQVIVTATPSPTATITPVAPATPTPMPTSTPTIAVATPEVEAVLEPEVEVAAEPEVTPSPTPVPTASVFTWPVKGNILTEHAIETLAYDVTMSDWRTHDGIDIAADLGMSVMAAAGGTVSAIDHHDLMGTIVFIDHGNGITSSYANLAAVPTVEVGDVVATGTVIGSVGDTAIAESNLPSHLHFAMSENGEAVNPVDYLPKLT